MKVFITVWNRHSWLDQLCKDFVRCNVKPVLIDNNSTYQPCIDWLKACPYNVEWRKDNDRPWAFFITELYQKYTDRYFMVSDSDQDISNVPDDFPSVLLGGLERHIEDGIWKCGLSQEINDIPLDNDCAKEIYTYEKGFWSNKTKYGFYKVWMDIGIAVYDRSRRGEYPNKEGNWYCAVRANRPYTSRHLDWYLSPDNIREEDKYYFNAKGAAHYGWGFKWYKEVFTK